MKHYANFIALTGIPSFRIYEILDSGACHSSEKYFTGKQNCFAAKRVYD